MIAAQVGAGLHRRRIGAGGPLGHRKTDSDFTIDQRTQVLLLLRWRAVLEQRDHRRVLRAHTVHGPRAEMREGSTDLDLHDRVGKMSEAHPTPLDRDERTPQTLLASCGLKLRDDVKEGAVANLAFGGEHDLVDELSDSRPHRLDIRRQLEIYHMAESATSDVVCQHGA